MIAGDGMAVCPHLVYGSYLLLRFTSVLGNSSMAYFTGFDVLQARCTDRSRVTFLSMCERHDDFFKGRC